MGYQLWTSPITGNRRRGTRLAELRRHFEDSITADAILEPLKSCPSTADAAEMAALLSARDFDVAGVQVIEGEPVIGYVRQEELAHGGRVHNHMRELTSSVLIADSTPLATCLSLLSETPIVFVLIGEHVRGVLTQWDLNKPAVRIYLFGILTLLELHITFWIRATYKDDSWQKFLSKGSRLKAQELLDSKLKKGHDSTLLDCVTLAGKANVVRSCREIQKRLDIQPDDVKRLTEMRNLRNSLAHATDDLAQNGSWAHIAELVVHIEKMIESSDIEVESEAAKKADGFVEDLWASA